MALLAGISTPWYTWLEQRRDIRGSPGMLDRLALALHLDESEQQHLFALAGQTAPPGREWGEHVPPGMLHFLDQLQQPACVLGRRWDYLAWNPAMTAVFGDLGAVPVSERNVLGRLFLDPGRRIFYTDWAGVAASTVARFRADSAAHLGDTWLQALIEHLQARSPDFRRFWDRHDVRATSDGLKDLQHPGVGRMLFENLLFRLPDAPDPRMMVYTPLADWDTPTKLRALLDVRAEQQAG